MLALLSPAKKLDFSAPYPATEQKLIAAWASARVPHFISDTEILHKTTAQLSQSDLRSLMKISDNLAALNEARFKAIQFPHPITDTRSAIYAFRGDTYQGLDADSLSAEDIEFAQKHIGILSGYYGVLRPLDAIMPYRLEMGTKLRNESGEDLYQFWQPLLAPYLQERLKDHSQAYIINLASQEYSKAALPKNTPLAVITPHFKDVKAGIPKAIGMKAKRARGMMARYLIQNKLEDPQQLKQFDMDGYQFQADISDDQNWHFYKFYDL